MCIDEFMERQRKRGGREGEEGGGGWGVREREIHKAQEQLVVCIMGTYVYTCLYMWH